MESTILDLRIGQMEGPTFVFATDFGIKDTAPSVVPDLLVFNVIQGCTQHSSEFMLLTDAKMDSHHLELMPQLVSQKLITSIPFGVVLNTLSEFMLLTVRKNGQPSPGTNAAICQPKINYK